MPATVFRALDEGRSAENENGRTSTVSQDAEPRDVVPGDGSSIALVTSSDLTVLSGGQDRDEFGVTDPATTDVIDQLSTALDTDSSPRVIDEVRNRQPTVQGGPVGGSVGGTVGGTGDAAPDGGAAPVPWWSDPVVAGVRKDGSPLPPALLFPDTGRPEDGGILSGPTINEPVLRTLDPEAGDTAPTSEQFTQLLRSLNLGVRVDETGVMTGVPRSAEQIANTVNETRMHIDGWTPDFSGTTPEALAATAAQLELRHGPADRPDPAGTRRFAAEMQGLAESTGELSAEQSTALDEALLRSQETEDAAVAVARENVATSRLRSSSDPEIDAGVRLLRSICGDTATANAMCAPLDAGVSGIDTSTGRPTGWVPAGVLPQDVRHQVEGPRRIDRVLRIVDGTASPIDTVNLETGIQEANAMLSAAQAEQGVTAPNELPNATERRQRLDETVDARVDAIRVARRYPGLPEADLAYQDYLNSVTRLREAMGIVEDESGVVVPLPTGEEVPRSGDPRPGLVLSEIEAADGLAEVVNPSLTGRELLQVLAGRNSVPPPPEFARDATPQLLGSVGSTQSSSPGSGPSSTAIPIGPGDGPSDVSLGGTEATAMVTSLFTDEGQRRLRSLLSTEQVVDPDDADQKDLFVADAAEQLRQLAINSGPLTREQADQLHPVPAPPDPMLVDMPEDVQETFQAYYDKRNAELAEGAMASHHGFEAPELACWVACYRDGTGRVLPELHVGGNYEVGGMDSSLAGLDLSDVTDLVSVHTHPLFVSTDGDTSTSSYNTTGLSAADVDYLDHLRSLLDERGAQEVWPGIASVSLLEGTVTLARRGPVPGGAPDAGTDPTGAEDTGTEPGTSRGPLLVRVLPSSPGLPVSGEVSVQVDDSGTIDYALAPEVEAPGVSEIRYAATRAAVESGVLESMLTSPPDLYGPGVVPPADPASAEPPSSRGLVVRPSRSSDDLPSPSDGSAPRQAIDPDRGVGSQRSMLPVPGLSGDDGSSIRFGLTTLPPAVQSVMAGDGYASTSGTSGDGDAPWADPAQVSLGEVRGDGDPRPTLSRSGQVALDAVDQVFGVGSTGLDGPVSTTATPSTGDGTASPGSGEAGGDDTGGGDPGGEVLPWWSDPDVAGVLPDGSTLPTSLLFPDTASPAGGGYISGPAVNEPVLRSFGERTGRPLDDYVNTNEEDSLRRRSANLDARMRGTPLLFRTPQANADLHDALGMIKAVVDGEEADFGIVSSEALDAALAQIDLRRSDAARPNVDGVGRFATAMQRLAESRGELTPEQSADLTSSLQESAEMRDQATAGAQQNLATSRLRLGVNQTTGDSIRFLRSVCGDGATANAMCAPLDEGVTGRGSLTGRPTGRVPSGVLPDEVRYMVGNPVHSVGRILSGTDSPLDTLHLETSIQEVDLLLTGTALPQQQEREAGGLPNAVERRRLLHEAWTERTDAVRAAREGPETPESDEAYRAYQVSVARLRNAMGVVEGWPGAVVPPPAGDEVPATGDPQYALAGAELTVIDGMRRNLRSPYSSFELGRRLTGRGLDLPDPTSTSEPTSQQPDQPPATATVAGLGTPTESGEAGGDGDGRGGGGIVIAPELPGPDPELDPNAANRIPVVQPPTDEDSPTDPPYVPEELGGFGEGPQPEGADGVTPPVGIDRPDLEMPVTTFPAAREGDRAGDATAVTYAPLPGGGQGTVVDEQRLAGTGDPRATVGSVTTVQDPRTGARFASVQPTTVRNADGTETRFIPVLSGSRVGYSPAGDTAAVYSLAEGESGRVDAGAEIQEVRVRTGPGTTLEFNGGGGADAVPGMAYRDPVYDNPVLEEWTIFPASSLDYETGVRRYSAQVPAGYEDRVDLTRPGTIRLRVPAGSRPTTVTRSVQAFTPYTPTPLPPTAPVTTTPVTTAPVTTAPTPDRASSPTATPATTTAPAQNRSDGVGGFLRQAGQVARDAWNDQPLTVRDLPDSSVEVAFPDARAVYDRNGNKLSGDAAAPDWVNPLQLATPGRALEELGTILENIPAIPIPGWDPLRQFGY